MVTHTRTKTRVGAIRFLNPLNPVRVVEGTDGRPQRIGNHPQLKVLAVKDIWRIDDEWWRETPVSRMYYDCQIDNGQRITIVRDLITGAWFSQQG